MGDCDSRGGRGKVDEEVGEEKKKGLKRMRGKRRG